VVASRASSDVMDRSARRQGPSRQSPYMRADEPRNGFGPIMGASRVVARMNRPERCLPRASTSSPRKRGWSTFAQPVRLSIAVRGSARSADEPSPQLRAGVAKRSACAADAPCPNSWATMPKTPRHARMVYACVGEGLRYAGGRPRVRGGAGIAVLLDTGRRSTFR